MSERPSHNWRNIRLAAAGALLSVAVLSVAAFHGPVRRWRTANKDYDYAYRPFDVFSKELSAFRRTLSFSVAVADKALAGTWSIQPNGVQSVWSETQEPLDAIWRGSLLMSDN